MSIQATNLVERAIAESEARGRSAHRVLTDRALYDEVCDLLRLRAGAYEEWPSDCDHSGYYPAPDGSWTVEIDYQHTV